MPNVQAHRSDADTTVSILARPVLFRPCVARMDPQYLAGITVRELPAVVGKARDCEVNGVQNSFSLSEIGRCRSTGGTPRGGRGWLFVKRDPGFGNMATAPMAAR